MPPPIQLLLHSNPPLIFFLWPSRKQCSQPPPLNVDRVAAVTWLWDVAVAALLTSSPGLPPLTSLAQGETPSLDKRLSHLPKGMTGPSNHRVTWMVAATRERCGGDGDVYGGVAG